MKETQSHSIVLTISIILCIITVYTLLLSRDKIEYLQMHNISLPSKKEHTQEDSILFFNSFFDILGNFTNEGKTPQKKVYNTIEEQYNIKDKLIDDDQTLNIWTDVKCIVDKLDKKGLQKTWDAVRVVIPGLRFL